MGHLGAFLGREAARFIGEQPGDRPRYRYRGRFRKAGPLRFLSHLDLSRLLLTLQGDGDYEGARELTETMGVIGDQLQADLDRLTRAGIPVSNQCVLLKGVNDSADGHDTLAGHRELDLDVGSQTGEVDGLRCCQSHRSWSRRRRDRNGRDGGLGMYSLQKL